MPNLIETTLPVTCALLDVDFANYYTLSNLLFLDIYGLTLYANRILNCWKFSNFGQKKVLVKSNDLDNFHWSSVWQKINFVQTFYSFSSYWYKGALTFGQTSISRMTLGLKTNGLTALAYTITLFTSVAVDVSLSVRVFPFTSTLVLYFWARQGPHH